MSTRSSSKAEGPLYLGFGLTVAVIFVGALVLSQAIRTLAQSGFWVAHTYEVIGQLEALSSSLREAESNQRGYLITGNSGYLEELGASKQRALDTLASVRTLVSDNPRQERSLDEVEKTANRRLQEFQYVVSLRSGGLQAAAARVKSGLGRTLMRQTASQISAMEQEEYRLLSLRQTVTAHSRQQAIVVLWVGLTLELASLLTAVFLARRLIAMLRQRERSQLASRMDLQRQVERRTAELRASNDELESFSYSVSHDLQSPLRHIGATAAMLREDIKPQLTATEDAEFDRIAKEVRRMRRLIEDLYTIARTARGEVSLSRLDLSGLVSEALRGAAARHPRTNVETIVPPGLLAEGDARMVPILIENLTRNAWKYSRNADPACIEFGVNQEGGQPVYFVSDNGAGFDPRFADKLFEPFERLHSNTEFEGTGLGLAICKKIVSRHGGQIWAEGEVGKGATFFFTLSPPFSPGATEPE